MDRIKALHLSNSCKVNLHVGIKSITRILRRIMFKYMVKLINMLIYAFFRLWIHVLFNWENPQRIYPNFNDTHLTRFVCGCIIIYSRSSVMSAVFIYMPAVIFTYLIIRLSADWKSHVNRTNVTDPHWALQLILTGWERYQNPTACACTFDKRVA